MARGKSPEAMLSRIPWPFNLIGCRFAIGLMRKHRKVTSKTIPNLFHPGEIPVYILALKFDAVGGEKLSAILVRSNKLIGVQPKHADRCFC